MLHSERHCDIIQQGLGDHHISSPGSICMRSNAAFCRSQMTQEENCLKQEKGRNNKTGKAAGIERLDENTSIDPGQQFTWENSNMEVNKPKNRYANVIAYDHSRVVLTSVDAVPGSDYINGNYIDGYRKQNAYIATQGPLPETLSDFWRMVWEQRSNTIVMMTRLEEKSRVRRAPSSSCTLHQ
ncbi:hypothetical protein GOODEAATRI_009654 [Goodea atripinnis]|uniref:protein-tyrosine-phosphatase n=1 Tax=Goodea atripinnis TaxID=208336 RepID=A0ABV0N025_9TELE